MLGVYHRITMRIAMGEIAIAQIRTVTDKGQGMKARCVMCDTGRWPYEPWLMDCPYCKGTRIVTVRRKRQRKQNSLDKPRGRAHKRLMKTTSQKNSFGGGYGINRNTGGSRSLSTAVPPYGSVARHPGTPSASATGKTGKKHFQGVKFR